MTPGAAILNGTIITPVVLNRPHRTLPVVRNAEGSIQWNADGIITHVDDHPATDGRKSTCENAFDARGLLVCPGFINLHIHGGMGVDTLDAMPETFAALARDQARQGVTAFLPTTASAAQETLLKVCETARTYLDQQSTPVVPNRPPLPCTSGQARTSGQANPLQGAEVLGLHIEGPYISPEKAGAQNPKHFRDPRWDEFCAWQTVSGNAVRLLALAPERDPDGTFIEKVVKSGVRVAAAHTNASYAITQIAIQRGLSHGTHVFNAMSRFDYRAPRVLEALLEDERVTVELIPDCTEIPHVHPIAIRLLKQLVGIDRICVITDAVSAAGMPDGLYPLGGLMARKVGKIAFLEEPWITRGERHLAGSVLEMNVGVRNLIELAGFSVAEAIQAAAANPARVLGLQETKGSLDVGKHADIVVLHPETFKVVATFVRGQKVYSNE